MNSISCDSQDLPFRSGYSHPGKSATIRESNHGSDVCKAHYAQHYVPKHSIFVSRDWRMEK